MSSHGGQTYFKLDNELNDGYKYIADSAFSLINKIPSIITATSCITNGFDSRNGYNDDPCLSEAFLRSPTNNVIAYYGSSRKGWTNRQQGVMGNTMQCISMFYQQLFNYRNQYDRNLGKVVAEAKSLTSNYLSINPALWYSLLSLNPMGDPEMPIFVHLYLLK